MDPAAEWLPETVSAAIADAVAEEAAREVVELFGRVAAGEARRQHYPETEPTWWKVHARPVRLCAGRDPSKRRADRLHG